MQRLSADDVVIGPGDATPEWQRRRIPCGEPARRALLDTVAGLAAERLVLHTCERLGVHGGGARAPLAKWLRSLSEWLGVAPERLVPSLHCAAGARAERHLLRLAAGLESQVPGEGEPQIQGQVRRALAEATAAGAVGPRLRGLAQSALHAGRRVRGETRWQA